MDVVRGAAIPDSEIFNLRPYHTASEALFGCGYRNVGQEKARDGMQQAHGKKKKRTFKGAIVPILLHTAILQLGRAFQKVRRAKKLMVAMMVSLGRQTDKDDDTD